jgi:hypothetical protein
MAHLFRLEMMLYVTLSESRGVDSCEQRPISLSRLLCKGLSKLLILFRVFLYSTYLRLNPGVAIQSHGLRT